MVALATDDQEGIVGFERASLIALLVPAACSPATVHHLPSITWCLRTALPRPGTGGRVTQTTDLPALLAEARRSRPDLVQFENFTPADPRLDVRVGLRGSRYRLHPGAVEFPLEVIDELDRMGCLSRPLVHRFGFDVSDLLEVALAASDAQVDLLASAWPEGGEIALTEADVSAAAGMLRHGVLSGSSDAPWFVWDPSGPQARALAWATSEPALSLTPRGLLLPGALAFGTGSDALVLPASLLLEGVIEGAARLEDELNATGGAAKELRELYESRIGHLIGQLRGHVVDATDDTAFGTDVTVLITERRSLRLLFPASTQQLAATRDLAENTRLSPRRGSASTAEEILLVVSDAAPFSAYGGVVVTGRHPLASALTGLDGLTQWALLADVAYHDGITALIAADIYDVASAWHEHYSIALDTTDQPVVVVRPSPPSWWEEAARWERFDAVLESASMPPTRRFTARSGLDETIAAVTYRDEGFMLYVGADPPMLVLVRGSVSDDWFSEACGIADSLISTAAVQDVFKQAITMAGDGMPLTIHLELHDELDVARSAEDEEGDSIPVGIAVDSSVRPTISIQLDQRWLELVAMDPEGGHRMLGDVLAHALRLLSPTLAEVAEQLEQAWDSFPPLVVMAFTDDVSIAGLPPRVPLHATALAWVNREVMARVGTSPGRTAVLTGKEAADYARNVLCPLMMGLLDLQLAALDSGAVLTLALGELDRGCGARLIRQNREDLSRYAPWGQAHQDIAERSDFDDAAQVRATELVIERLLLLPSRDAQTPDAVDWSRLLATAHRVAELAIRVSRDTAGVDQLVVILEPDRGLVVGAEPADVFDEVAHHRAVIAARLSPDDPDTLVDRSASVLASRGDGDVNPFRSLDGTNDDVRVLDEAMREHLGFGLDALSAVAGTARTWATVDGQVSLARNELLGVAAEWSQLAEETLDAALGFMSLSPESVAAAPFDYWKLDKRSQRLATRPFVALGDTVHFSTNRIRLTQDVLLGYLDDGRLPWPDLPQPVVMALGSIRQARNKRVEQRVASIARDGGLIAVRNVTPKSLRRVDLVVPQTFGDIDVLAGDPARRRLWVFEAKDLQRPFTPVEQVASVRKFHEPEGHLDRHLRRVTVVSDNRQAFGRCLGLAADGWEIGHAIVTPAPERAAFVPEPRASFVCLPDLADLLVADEQAAVHGHYLPRG